MKWRLEFDLTISIYDHLEFDDHGHVVPSSEDQRTYPKQPEKLLAFSFQQERDFPFVPVLGMEISLASEYSWPNGQSVSGEIIWDASSECWHCGFEPESDHQVALNQTDTHNRHHPDGINTCLEGLIDERWMLNIDLLEDCVGHEEYIELFKEMGGKITKFGEDGWRTKYE